MLLESAAKNVVLELNEQIGRRGKGDARLGK